jgi:cobalamin biosynthesis protein CobT
MSLSSLICSSFDLQEIQDSPSDEGEGQGQEGSSGEGEGQPSPSGRGSGSKSEEELTPEEVAQVLLQAMGGGAGSGAKDLAEALAEVLKQARDEDGEAVSDDGQEAPWNPWSTSGDKVIRPSNGENGREEARLLLQSVRTEVAFLRARLRNKFLEAKQPRVMHGVRQGEALSERRLADSWAEIQSGIAPTRPDVRTVRREQVGIAVAVVIDESGSMSRRREAAMKALLTCTSPLDELGCPTLALGFRDGGNYHSLSEGEYDPTRPYHRSDSVHIDLFKGWDEPMRNCLGRFSQVRATGGTPMADGVQFALQALSNRQERHRIMLVITDGDPDYTHRPVVRRQIRLAREAGITVVGVGIDSGCASVPQLFPTHIIVKNLKELPEKLLETITAIAFPRVPGRLHLDGKMGTKVSRAA